MTTLSGFKGKAGHGFAGFFPFCAERVSSRREKDRTEYQKIVNSKFFKPM
jgi:hypothetical protein